MRRPLTISRVRRNGVPGVEAAVAAVGSGRSRRPEPSTRPDNSPSVAVEEAAVAEAVDRAR